MIKLHIEDYCHNCPDFEADVDKDQATLRTHDPLNIDYVLKVVCTTTVSCKHQHRCKAVKKYLESHKPEEEK